jgi:hypothetical protein
MSICLTAQQSSPSRPAQHGKGNDVVHLPSIRQSSNIFLTTRRPPSRCRPKSGRRSARRSAQRSTSQKPPKAPQTIASSRITLSTSAPSHIPHPPPVLHPAPSSLCFPSRNRDDHRLPMHRDVKIEIIYSEGSSEADVDPQGD